jgi:hypothetical protein
LWFVPAFSRLESEVQSRVDLVATQANARLN